MRGFTLIELLVVTAIIGILSAVVLTSLSTARSRDNDVAIRANLVNLQSQSRIYFTSHQNYGDNAVAENDCGASDNLFADQTVVSQLAAIAQANNNRTIECTVAAGGVAYAVSAALVANSGRYFCVDSTGVGTTTSRTLGTRTSC